MSKCKICGAETKRQMCTKCELRVNIEMIMTEHRDWERREKDKKVG